MTPKVDVFSAGCVLLRLLAFHLCEENDARHLLGCWDNGEEDDVESVQWRLKRLCSSASSDENIGEQLHQAVDLAVSMVQQNPEMRPSSAEVLEHPFLLQSHSHPSSPTHDLTNSR